MTDYGPCHCGYRLVRRIEEDEKQFECVGCKQLLMNFEETHEPSN